MSYRVVPMSTYPWNLRERLFFKRRDMKREVVTDGGIDAKTIEKVSALSPDPRHDTPIRKQS